MDTTQNISLVEVFQCADRHPTDYRKLRFILKEGKKFFVMAPKALNCSSIRLKCHRNNCKVTLSVNFCKEIETKIDSESGKKPRWSRQFAPGTEEEMLMSTSSYAIETHKVSKLKASCYNVKLQHKRHCGVDEKNIDTSNGLCHLNSHRIHCKYSETEVQSRKLTIMTGKRPKYSTLVDLTSVTDEGLYTSESLRPIPLSILEEFPGGLINKAVFEDGHCIDFEPSS